MAKKANVKTENDRAVKYAAEAIIENALNMHATDVHIEPRDGLTLIRLRVNGLLKVTNQLPADVSPKLVRHFKRLGGLNQREKNFPQTATIPHGKAKIRISTSPVVDGEKITLRLIRARTSLRSLDQIGLWGENLRLVRQAIRQPRGIIFTVGDGRNTTNFSILTELNSPEKNIVTVERQIEKVLPGANQTEIKPSIGLDYIQSTQAALNQNPDIIMVDEVATSFTAKLLFEASMRGKLIIASLPVPTAADVLPFLVNLDISPFIISANTNAIIGQTLVRSTSPSSMTSRKLKRNESSVILKEFETTSAEVFKLEKLARKYNLGTSSDLNSTKDYIDQLPELKNKTNDPSFDYVGSTGIFEIFSFINGDTADKLRDFALTQPSSTEVDNYARKIGITSLKLDGLVKNLRGLTTLEEVLRKAGL